MTKNMTIFITFIFYHYTVVKQGHYMKHLSSYANTVLFCSHCKIHRFVAAPYILLSWIQ
jgi:hypothetical protein